MLTYKGAHLAVVRARGRASAYPCWGCGKQARQWAYANAYNDPEALVDDRQRVYSASLDAYIPMCISCHFSFDTGLDRLHGLALVLDHACPFCGSVAGEFCRKPNGSRYPAGEAFQHSPRLHLAYGTVSNAYGGRPRKQTS